MLLISYKVYRRTLRLLFIIIGEGVLFFLIFYTRKVIIRNMAKTHVVFIKDAPPHGRAGDIKDVAGGFFRNALMPQGSAVLASSDRIKQAEAMQRKRAHAAETHRERMEVWAKELNGFAIEFVKKANEQGGLFDAVDTREILAVLHQKGFTGIEEKHIDMERPFDKIGTYTLSLNFGENFSMPSVTIIIKKE